jgi:short-subunit dehydrogenase
MQQLTAIITGASEGLGKSFAIELARRNINLVLGGIARFGVAATGRVHPQEF